MIRKKESAAILQSLTGGVVPRVGLEHIVIGRKSEIQQILSDLADVKDGGAYAKFLIGDFGSGKTFLLSLIRYVALTQKFVVTEADFTPERRLFGDGKGLAIYAELARNLSTQARPDGNALPAIMQRWIDGIQSAVADGMSGTAQAGGSSMDSPAFTEAVKAKVRETIRRMEDMVGGFDFAEVVNAYYRGYLEGDDALMNSALRWLRGEYSSKTDARRDLGVRDIIGDSNWYDYLKLLGRFIVDVGYSGLVVNLDEAINLFKISHAQNRAKNYEVILNIYNDAHQGRLSRIYILFGGTTEFLEDERRGLYSYEALRSRLKPNQFETDQYRDLSQPVMRLKPLLPEELLALLYRLRDIHAGHFEYEPTVTDDEISAHLQRLLSRPGASRYITAREVIRTFMNGLNILRQNPEMPKSLIFSEAEKQLAGGDALDQGGEESSPLSRFHVRR